MTAPLFAPNDIIDIRYKFGKKLPDRLLVNMVYMKGGSKEWMYNVFSERDGSNVYMSESGILAEMSHKNARCYDNKLIEALYLNGYRFCGNYKEGNATNTAESIKKSSNTISSIRLVDAINEDNKRKYGYLGMWVRYGTTVNDRMSDAHIDLILYDSECETNIVI